MTRLQLVWAYPLCADNQMASGHWFCERDRNPTGGCDLSENVPRELDTTTFSLLISSISPIWSACTPETDRTKLTLEIQHKGACHVGRTASDPDSVGPVFHTAIKASDSLREREVTGAKSTRGQAV